MLDPVGLSSAIEPFCISNLKAFAKVIGFDRLGITSSDPPAHFELYKDWISSGYAADLGYMTESTRVEKRGDLHKILPGVRSVVVGAISYAPKKSEHPSDAKIARYAWGDDYHAVMTEKLNELAIWLTKNIKEPFQYLTYVDTGPILERSLAERGGVGWIGKNCCVMHESTGSYLYLGELLTTLSLPFDTPALNRCGICTRCIDACPTEALVAPYRLNSEKCLSYQTIESRAEELPSWVASNQNGWIAGCDICQEVCPWNQEPLHARLDSLQPKLHINLSLAQAERLTEKAHAALFKNTSLNRIKYPKFLRNIRSARQEKR